MAPRIASDCFPDDSLMVDYDDVGAPAPIGRRRGPRWGGGRHAGGGDGTGMDMDDAAADAMAMMADEGAMGAPAAPVPSNDTAASADGGDDANTASSIQNDPLSAGHPSIIGRSHSSGGGTMETTISVAAAAVAQHAWDQFVAGQGSVGGSGSGSGSGGGGGGGGGEGGGSPTSMSHAASLSSAVLKARLRGMTLGNPSSTLLSACSNPAPISTIPGDGVGSHAAAAPGALSFRGFHTPQCRSTPLSGGGKRQ